jgi:predicted DNA-binding protein
VTSASRVKRAVKKIENADIKEAIELYLEPVEDDFTTSSNTEIIEVAVDQGACNKLLMLILLF